VTVVSFPHPDDYPDAWSTVVLAGVATPGVAEVSGGTVSYKWDKKQSKGASGATSTFKGREISKPSFKLHLCRDYYLGVDHVAAYLERVLPVLQGAMRANKPQALDAYHPAWAANGIGALVIEEIGQLESKGNGLWTVEIKCSEYRPPKPAGGTPKGSKGAGAGEGGEDWQGLGRWEEVNDYAEQAGEELGGAIDYLGGLLA